MRFVKDYVGVDFHNDGHSHIDALCHVAYEGRLFNGVPQGSVTAEGASADAIELLKDGLVGRGVLLDIPRLRGVPWLEPGDAVVREDLEGAERAQGVTVAEGDVLLVRTGHARRLAELGPWDTASAKAGPAPHRGAVPRRARHRRAGLRRQQRHGAEHYGGRRLPDPRAGDQRDGRPPPRLPPVRGPARACERLGRWEFLFAAPPLRIVGGTGSPLNPIAIL